MHRICEVTTRRKKIRIFSNVDRHPKNYLKDLWEIVFGLKDRGLVCHTSGSRCLHYKYVKNRKPSSVKRRKYLRKNLPRLFFSLQEIMKQISNIKKKLGQGKKSEIKQQQNGQHKKKVKKPLKKKAAVESHPKNNLNVNQRPVRKKKKTKKYEGYERNGKSPEPEVKHETNLLLALGLTPVNKEESEKLNLNRMHVMEEGNGKVTADTAELPETQADLPKKANTSGKTPESVMPLVTSGTVSKELSQQQKINGVSNEPVQIPDGKNLPEADKVVKSEDLEAKDGFATVRLPSAFTSIEINPDPNGKKESQGDEEEEKEKEKSSEPQDLTVTCTPSFENSSKTSQNDKYYTNNKIISISVEQCQINSDPLNSISEDSEKLKKPKPITNRKRSNRSTDSDESYKANYKRQRFPDIGQEERERTVSEYVEKASGTSLEELQMNTEKLQQEIHSLSALARAKELEWNDIIRLKKVKEEMYLRLVRKKQVMLLSMGGSGRMSETATWDFASDNRMSDFVTNDEVSYNRVLPSTSPKPPPRIPSNLTITKSQSNPNQNLERFLMQPQGASDPKPNTSLMMVPIVSSTPISISSTSYLPRPHLPTPLKIPMPDREKLKGANNRNNPVPILPKPNQNVNQTVNNHSPPIGRQGPIVDVKSIIADYRQNHPEQVPRRGRRKGQPSQNFAETMISSGRGVLSMSSLALGSGSQVRTVGSNPDLPGVSGQNGQESSRPSSADSNRSTSNAPNEVPSAGGVSFKDVLVQFAKMSQHQQGSDRRISTPPAKSQNPSKAPPYPEVTLHPVLPAGAQSPPNPSSSLLHGILTKNNGGRNENQHNVRSTTFSPTLARLLTTPDRSSISTTITTALRGSNSNATATRVASGPVSITDLLSTSKNRNELTITPIISNLQPAKIKEDVANVSDEDPEDNADRLVIDESEEQDPRNEEDDVEGETIPECQGCHVKSAQFVCAGCGNQWYCSRNCQVTAWDEHSEVCSG